MPFELRPLNVDKDFPRLAEIMSSIEPDPTEAEDLLRRERAAPAERIRRYMVAVDDTGHIVGYCNTVRLPWMPEGHFYVNLKVDAPARHRGIGSALWEDGFAFAREHGATNWRAEVPDNCEECLRFVEKRGFAIANHAFNSALDLTTFDESRFAGAIERVEAQGIHFFSLADAGDTPEARHKLYELNAHTALDVPGSDGTFDPFEYFSKQVFGAVWFRADGQILAGDGARYVGLGALAYYPETGLFYNAHTGVHREYRGRGIALALKLLVIRKARELGATSIKTDNDSQNAPMLAINTKLGYVREPGIYIVRKRVS